MTEQPPKHGRIAAVFLGPTGLALRGEAGRGDLKAPSRNGTLEAVIKRKIALGLDEGAISSRYAAEARADLLAARRERREQELAVARLYAQLLQRQSAARVTKSAIDDLAKITDGAERAARSGTLGAFLAIRWRLMFQGMKTDLAASRSAFGLDAEALGKMTGLSVSTDPFAVTMVPIPESMRDVTFVEGSNLAVEESLARQRALASEATATDGLGAMEAGIGCLSRARRSGGDALLFRKRGCSVKGLVLMAAVLTVSSSVFADAGHSPSAYYVGDGDIADFALDVGDGGAAMLYLTHKPGNEPFVGATVTLQPAEGGKQAVKFEPDASPGAYKTWIVDAASLPGQVLVQTAEDSDAIETVVPKYKLSSAAPAAVSSTALTADSPNAKVLGLAAGFGALAAAAVGLLLWLLFGRKGDGAKVVVPLLAQGRHRRHQRRPLFVLR